MRFDLHLRSQVKQQVTDLAAQMHAWEVVPRIDDAEQKRLTELITPFEHCTSIETLSIAGVDGSGDYPSVTYGDSFVYLTVAQGTIYDMSTVRGMLERGPLQDPLVVFTWIPEEHDKREKSYYAAFEALSGMPVEQVISESDYRDLKGVVSKRNSSCETLKKALIMPHASEAGNIGIQFRSTGELGAAVRILTGDKPPEIVLIDTTFSLPTISNPEQSLFFEHLRRWCCVEARKKGVVFAALSKSHGLPSIGLIEQLAKEKAEHCPGGIAEHWYLRFPDAELDGWVTSVTDGRSLPPVGAITYLVRFHRTTPVMRVDLDREYWTQNIYSSTQTEMQKREQTLFSKLDYSGHDQRCYGYPYPIKAAHDRASLTKPERVVLRKQIIDAAVKAGMKRSLFRDVSRETGHA